MLSTTLCILSMLQSAYAIALSTILPTGTHYVTSEPPQTTPETKLHRRDSSKTTGIILSDTPNACGWYDTYIDLGKYSFQERWIPLFDSMS